MEKNRAIELLEHLAWDRDIERNPYGDALNIAIEALKAQLSQEGTTSDTISRQAALDIFDDYNISVENGELEAYSRDRKRLCELPGVQPERKKGEWIEITSINHTYKCSECGRLLVNITDGRNNVSKHYPYCHCGADMRGERQK